MSETLAKLKPQLDTLSDDERAELIGYLMGDNEDMSQEELENYWVEEVNRRVADLEAGRTVALPAEDVMRRMKEIYG